MGIEPGSTQLSLTTTQAILDLARLQHGVVSRRQLLEAGLSSRMVDDRVAALRLTRIFPGVYGLGPGVTSQRGLWLAATMSCGRRVAISHRSAGQMWGLGVNFRRIELVSGSMRTGRINSYVDRGLIVHQTRSLPDDHLARVDGILVTSLGRTFIDMAAVCGPGEMTAAFNEADRLGKLNLAELAELVDSTRGRKGLGILRRLVRQRDPRNRLTRSELESQFLALCVESDLPVPEVNCRVLEFEVDCFWPAIRMIVELDGLAFHSSPSSVERDHRRDAKLQAAGHLVLRLTYRDVTESPRDCVNTVKAHLARAAAIHRLVPH